MKICMFKGGIDLVQNSGIYQSYQNQIKILEDNRISYVQDLGMDCDIVQINTIFPSSWFRALLAHLTGQRVLYYAHSTEEDFRRSFIGSNTFSKLFRLWITACYRTADILVTPTKYSATLLSRYRQLRVPIVPVSNGIDLEEFYPDPQAGRRFREEYGFSPEQKVVLGIGHYIERKGILDFIELAKKMPEYAFVWFGFTDAYLLPAPVRHALKNAPDNLLFPGYVQRSKIREAYCGADVFVFPTYEETEGLALLEAMASQIPVIVRDIPIYAHWVKDKTDVYKCKSLPEFEDTLRGILHGKLPDLTAQARETVRQRSIDHSARELLKVYRALLIGRRRKSVQDKASAKSGKKGKFNWG